MRRALVLGGRGFLGRHAVAELVAAGFEVETAPPRRYLDLLAADVTAVGALLLTARPDVVVNATGQVLGTPEQLERGNAEVVRRLLVACARTVPGVRLVHLGSLAEYGPGHGVPLVESDRPQPVSAYGRSKLAATREVLAAQARGEIEAVVLRVANPIGAHQPHSTLAGAVTVQLRADPDAPVRVGGLDGERDFVSARDVGRSVVAAATGAGPIRAGAVNVGTGRPVPVRRVVQLLLELAGHSGEIVIDGAPQRSGSSGPGQVIVPDVELARRALGWSAADSLDDGLTAVLSGSGLGPAGLDPAGLDPARLDPARLDPATMAAATTR